MAEKKGVNKSEEIRKAAKAMQDKGEKPRPVVIIAALKKQGITVSSPQVSMVLKRMGLRPSRGRKAAAAGGRSGAISIEDLLRLLDCLINPSIQSFFEPPTYLTFDPSSTL